MPEKCLFCRKGRHDNITLFSMPWNKASVLNEWCRIIKASKPEWKLKRGLLNIKVCSDHFQDTDFVSSPTVYNKIGLTPPKKFCLLPTAVPSRNLSCNTSPYKETHSPTVTAPVDREETRVPTVKTTVVGEETHVQTTKTPTVRQVHLPNNWSGLTNQSVPVPSNSNGLMQPSVIVPSILNGLLQPAVIVPSNSNGLFLPAVTFSSNSNRLTQRAAIVPIQIQPVSTDKMVPVSLCHSDQSVPSSVRRIVPKNPELSVIKQDHQYTFKTVEPESPCDDVQSKNVVLSLYDDENSNYKTRYKVKSVSNKTTQCSMDLLSTNNSKTKHRIRIRTTPAKAKLLAPVNPLQFVRTTTPTCPASTNTPSVFLKSWLQDCKRYPQHDGDGILKPGSVLHKAIQAPQMNGGIMMNKATQAPNMKDGIMINKATQVNASAVQWLKQFPDSKVPQEYIQPKHNPSILMPPLLKKVIKISEDYGDLTYSVHYGCGSMDTYIQLTRKCWNTYAVGNYPVRLTVMPNGEASLHKQFLPTEDYDLLIVDDKLDRDLLTSLLEYLSVKGWHFHCPGIDVEDLSECEKRKLVKFTIPYLRHQSRCCQVYYRGAPNASKATASRGIRRCINCNKTIRTLKMSQKSRNDKKTYNLSPRFKVMYPSPISLKLRRKVDFYENLRKNGRKKWNSQPELMDIDFVSSAIVLYTC